MDQHRTSPARPSTSMRAIAAGALVVCSIVVTACAVSPAAPAAPAAPASAVPAAPAAPAVPAAPAARTPLRDRLDSEYLRSIATDW